MSCASARPIQSVAGCRYSRGTGPPANCCMTVNGWWCRPTMSVPKILSEGTWSTGTAMTSVTTMAIARTAATSRGRDHVSARGSPIDTASCDRGHGGPAAQPPGVRHGHHDEERPDPRPRAHIAHVRREASVAGEDVQGHQGRHLGQPEESQAGQEAPPPHGDEGRHPEREVETHLEGREEGDRALRIVERSAGEDAGRPASADRRRRAGQHVRVLRAEQPGDRDTERYAQERPA